MKPPQDGLYRVCLGSICAGFVIRDGRVESCAPILRRKLPYFVKLAQRIGD